MQRYHPLLVTLHWLLALMILGGLFAGNFILAPTANDDPFKLTSLMMHMSMGIAILVLMLIRIIVRLRTEKPAPAETGTPALDRLGGIVHWTLYLAVIALATSGVATSIQAGLPAIVFGGSGEPLPEDFTVYQPRVAHGILATIVGLLIFLHIAAALWHQFVRRDGLISRMWYGRRGG